MSIPGAASVVDRADAARSQIMLTFDDGPDPHGTPAVLDVLGRLGIRATFFLLSERARADPGLLREMVARGHGIGLHGDVHDRLDRLPTATLACRLRSARSTLERLTGREIRHHRPPYGFVSGRFARAARLAGLLVVLWSHDPRDWEPRPPAESDRRLRSCLVPGALVLLHDGCPSFPGQGEATAACLDRVGPLIAERGLQAVALET